MYIHIYIYICLRAAEPIGALALDSRVALFRKPAA